MQTRQTIRRELRERLEHLADPFRVKQFMDALPGGR
jgi:hypothetical protein